MSAYLPVYNRTGDPVVIDVSGATIPARSYGVVYSASVRAQSALTRGELTLVTEAISPAAQTAIDDAASRTAAGPPLVDVNTLPDVPARTVTASTTLLRTDRLRAVEVDNSAAATVTIPANVFGAGDVVHVTRLGNAGSVTLAAGTGLTLRPASPLTLAGRWSTATIRFRSPTEAVITAGARGVLPAGSLGVAAAAGTGTAPPAPTSSGNERGGTVSWGTGTTPAAGAQVTISFAALPRTPAVSVSPANAATAALGLHVTGVTNTGLTVAFATAPAASAVAGTYSAHLVIVP